jgi:hypothetical protein
MSATATLSIRELRRSIIDEISPIVRFSPEDAAMIARHRDLLTELGEPLVKMFYDTLFAHAPTRAIFRDSERPAREETLRRWWSRLIGGPIDDDFWDWMTVVGLVHIERRVSNPMMIGIWGGIAILVGDHAARQIGAAEALQLQGAFIRFGQTLTSLVAESYLRSYLNAVARSTGTSVGLLDSLARGEVDTLLAVARSQLG